MEMEFGVLVAVMLKRRKVDNLQILIGRRVGVIGSWCYVYMYVNSE